MAVNKKNTADCRIFLTETLSVQSGLLDGRKPDDTVRIQRTVEDTIVIVHQRQAEDGLVHCVQRAADLEAGLPGGGEIGLPVGLRRADKPDILALLTGQNEIDIWPRGEIQGACCNGFAGIAQLIGLLDKLYEFGIQFLQGGKDGFEHIFCQ